MSTKMSDFGIDRLSVDDRINLMNEIWDSVTAEPGHSFLTSEQRQELERRLAEHQVNPDDVVSWEEVKAQALARFERR